jgi:outer membrane lipoprotein-sorting protein
VSMFRSRPALRWLVPSAAAVIVIGGGAAAGTIVASADPSLPDRSAAQLLVDVQNAKLDGLSGTVVESADLGLPAIAGVTGGQGDADLTRLIAGSNTARVWYAGEDKARLALMGTLGETDVIRNGTDVWMWSSRDSAATHLKIPAGSAKEAAPLAGGVPTTPQEAAEQALAAINPTTVVSTTGAAKVAGRNAYELVLSPRDTGSLIGQVRLAIDAVKHIPLRVDVYAKGADNPAVRVAFQQISFTTPDAEQFVFKAPPGTKVTESDAKSVEEQHRAAAAAKIDTHKPVLAQKPTVLGSGWTSIVAAKLPATTGTEKAQLSGVINTLPKVSGNWGTGHLLAGSLFSVLVTDDGRVFGGAVAPESLYQAAAKK